MELEEGNELRSLNDGRDVGRFHNSLNSLSESFESEGKKHLVEGLEGYDDDEDDDLEHNSLDGEEEDEDDALDMERASRFLTEFAEGASDRKGPCDWADALFCLCFPRIGNMHVLFQTKCRSTGRSRLWCVVGPFWPCTLCITYPLLLLVALGLGFAFSQRYPVPLAIVWYLVAGGCLIFLACTACSDPGIVRREPKRIDRTWTWTSQTSSYRPSKSIYCRDCNCVIEEYDHVCPWTGTAIGKKNMCCFQAFVSSCALMFVMAIFITVAGTLFMTNGDPHHKSVHHN